MSTRAIKTSKPEIIAARFEEKTFLSIIKRKNNMINAELWYVYKKKKSPQQALFTTLIKKLLNSDLDTF